MSQARGTDGDEGWGRTVHIVQGEVGRGVFHWRVGKACVLHINMSHTTTLGKIAGRRIMTDAKKNRTTKCGPKNRSLPEVT